MLLWSSTNVKISFKRNFSFLNVILSQIDAKHFSGQTLKKGTISKEKEKRGEPLVWRQIID